MRHSLVVFLCFMIIAIVPPAHARELSVYCEYPAPKDSDLYGGRLIYEQVWELLRRAGFDTQIETVSWKRGYAEALIRADVALFPTTFTKEREPLFHWIGPILEVEWAFFAHADSGISVNSLEEAKAVKSIGTYAQDSKEVWLKNHGFNNLVSVLDNITNLKKLYEGRIDLMVGSPGVTDNWPAEHGYDSSKMVTAFKFNTVKLYFAVSKETSKETVSALRSAFDSMRKDGTIDAIYHQWAPGWLPPKD
ncbi:conserved exported protein of unknown function [Pseudodesulfovibrio profundus]|uniref:Solute-binding protein family 3/N-terminal domain-containing protein n=1 Tax=Pseudodesulfovibrio profundus TaxID=57320 RepID=A0A2C8F9X1_9BACT|nr:conserved exported protein of unknown function [Pseudodesulfovibrio profundus]